ncbi:MFS transporter [Micromonospora sp. NPDC005299]|uniref:MFS transporter n=1 Tax=Micromonospora sp. NPDC005299 TaxID=3364231 RepID=UPI0036B4ACAB
MLLVGLNLRPAITSLGAVLEEVRHDLGMSGTATGLLTALPVLCFALVGAVTPALMRRLSHEKIVAASLAMLVAGLTIRPITSLPSVFMVASTLSLTGIAVANVVLPGLLKEYFPNRAGPVSALFGVFIALGTSAGAALTVPAGHTIGGGWRAGLAVWSAVGALALFPWLVAAHAAGRSRHAPRPSDGVRAWRSGRAWALVAFWAFQSAQAYVLFGWLPVILQDAGHTPAEAGWLLALLSALGVPVAFVVAAVQRRRDDHRMTTSGLMLCYVGGYIGLACHTGHLTVLWVSLLGIASGAFSLMLSLLTTRSLTSAGTDSLSAFVQSLGYLLSGGVPIVAGWLSSQTGSWRPLLIMMMVLLVPQTVAGLIASRPWLLEQDVRDRDTHLERTPPVGRS